MATKVSQHLREADKSLQEAWKMLDDMWYHRFFPNLQKERPLLSKRISELALQIRKLAEYFEKKEE